MRLIGLVVNFAGNVVMLHGAVRYFAGDATPMEMALGIAITVVCNLLLAFPLRLPL